MNVWDAIRTKKAVRIFTDQPLPDEAVHRILEAGRRAQSSKNQQPWHFIAVRDREKLQALAQTGHFMQHVAGAALAVALIIPIPTEGVRPWVAPFDVGQAAAYMQLAAHEMGIGSCLGAVYEPDQARALLGFPDEMIVHIVISFGYPAPDQPRPKVTPGRKPFDEITHFEQW